MSVSDIDVDDIAIAQQADRAALDCLARFAERAGVPVFIFRAGPLDLEGDDERRDWDVLVPASSEAPTIVRFGARRAALLADADAWRAAGMPEPPFVPAPRPPHPSELVP